MRGAVQFAIVVIPIYMQAKNDPEAMARRNW